MEYVAKMRFYKEIMFDASDEEMIAIRIRREPFSDLFFRKKPANKG
jgi:hypothetical protein